MQGMKRCFVRKNSEPETTKSLSNELAPKFHRRQFCFELDTLIVVEVDVITYEEARLLIGARFRPINAFCFQDLLRSQERSAPFELQAEIMNN